MKTDTYFIYIHKVYQHGVFSKDGHYSCERVSLPLLLFSVPNGISNQLLIQDERRVL